MPYQTFPAPPNYALVLARREKTQIVTSLVPLIGFALDEMTMKVSAIPLIDPTTEMADGTYRTATLDPEGTVYESKSGRVFDSVDEWAATIRVTLGVKVDMSQDPPVESEPANPGTKDPDTGAQESVETAATARTPRLSPQQMVGPPVGKSDAEIAAELAAARGETPAAAPPAPTAPAAEAPKPARRRRKAAEPAPTPDAPEDDISDLV